MRITFWYKEPSVCHTSWFRLASASTVKDNCTSCQRRLSWTQNFTLILCYKIWLQTATRFCQLASLSNRTVQLHSAHTACVAQDWIATNCTGFIGNDEWPLNSPDLNPLDYYVWGDNARALPHVSDEAKKHWRAKRCPAVNLGSVATEFNQNWWCWVSPRDYEHVLKLVLDTSNILWNKPLFCVIELLCLWHVNCW